MTLSPSTPPLPPHALQYTEDGTDFWVDTLMECVDGTAREGSVVRVQVTLGDPAASEQAPYVKDLQIKLQPPPRSS